MQGFNYAQLKQALLDWPKLASTEYVNNINRLIYLGEIRVDQDLDMEPFDPFDTVVLAPGATTITKPPGSQTITFTAALSAGAVAGTLTAAWTGATGLYPVTFSDNELMGVTLTNSSTSATWPNGLAAAQTSAIASVSSQFITERNMWVTYNGALFPLVKRSQAFVRMYQAVAGQPKYYCEFSPTTWGIAPAADANATAITRHYIQRQLSIVAAGNTYYGDNFGQLLFCAVLMEAEQFLKADDRYADMKAKYFGELLPQAREDAKPAMKTGVSTPLQPDAMPAPPPMMPQMAQQEG